MHVRSLVLAARGLQVCGCDVPEFIAEIVGTDGRRQRARPQAAGYPAWDLDFTACTPVVRRVWCIRDSVRPLHLPFCNERARDARIPT